jgi:hypothetical protein
MELGDFLELGNSSVMIRYCQQFYFVYIDLNKILKASIAVLMAVLHSEGQVSPNKYYCTNGIIMLIKLPDT